MLQPYELSPLRHEKPLYQGVVNLNKMRIVLALSALLSVAPLTLNCPFSGFPKNNLQFRQYLPTKAQYILEVLIIKKKRNTTRFFGPCEKLI